MSNQSSKLKTKASLATRPPIVCIMGHIDHGKTTLLDTIQKTNVATKEAGKITQHIRACQVECKGKLITFIDTPGHEAFQAMRKRGSQIGDIALIVIDTVEGIKDQTKEVISYAKKAKVPTIVALNKIDLPQANLEKAKRQLQEIDLTPEEWGGKTITCEISAKTGKGVDGLLEMIKLVAEMEELKADPNASVLAQIIESHLDKNLGPVATIIIKDGTLKINDIVVADEIIGKIRLIKDFQGRRIPQALPSMPVLIAGLNNVPKAGAILNVSNTLAEAQEIAEKKAQTILQTKRAKKTTKTILNIILKTDCQGSLEAIQESLKQIKSPEVRLNIVLSSIGNINEQDLLMAKVSKAQVSGFNVKIDRQASEILKREHIPTKVYNVIYELIQDVEKKLKTLIKPKFEEICLGKVKIKAIFRKEKKSMIVGGKVSSGEIQNKNNVKILREKKEIGQGKLTQLQQDKKDVVSVKQGQECGMKIETEIKIEEGDIIEVYKMEEKLISNVKDK